MPPISGAWAKALEGEFHKPYYKKLFETVGKEYATHQIFPAGDDIFNAFHFTPLDQVKVVIPRRRTGARALFFGKTGCGDSAFTGEYLQRTGR